MAFDANGILHGEYSGALVDCDESDAVATSKTVNSDGNGVIEIDKTGIKGLTAVLILTESADSDAYDDEANITIEASDELDRHWREVARFPTLHAHIRKVWITATTAFVAGDIGKDLTESTSTDTGKILYISDELFTVGGKGYVLIEMDAAGDVFDEAVDTVETATAGTGVGTKTKASEAGTELQMQPGLYTVQFKTPKKYVRCNCEDVEDNIGKIWILLTNHQDMVDSDLA